MPEPTAKRLKDVLKKLAAAEREVSRFRHLLENSHMKARHHAYIDCKKCAGALRSLIGLD